MHAWRVHGHGPYREVLRWEEAPQPLAPGPAAIRVAIRAAGVNFPDILAIAGKYQVKAQTPFTPGTEFAGQVVAAGPGSRFRSGDRVVAFGLGGAFGEEATVPDDFAWPIPDGMSMDDAAAMTVVYQTSHVALFRRAGLRAGETLLVHGGAGGVGTAAIQLGKAVGATVIATAGDDTKLEVCRRCGADQVVNYRDDDFVARVMAATVGRGADVIYDPVGGDVFDRSLKCVAWEGRILVIGFTSGRIPTVAVNRVLLKNIAVVGVNWPNYQWQNHDVLDAAQTELMQWYGAGKIRPVIYGTWPMQRLPDALQAIEDRQSYGKIVLTV